MHLRNLRKILDKNHYAHILHERFSHKSAFFCQNLTREKLREALLFFGAKILYEKCVRKTLMKSMAGINFIKLLCAAFDRTDPECAKKDNVFLRFYDLRAQKLKSCL